MLDNKGFDLWADEYDKSTVISDNENTYPFAGYNDVLSAIYKIVSRRKKTDILDIGFGTGALTAKLYKDGCNIFGQDFSSKMIELAQLKMPNAHLYQGDFSEGLVDPLSQKNYDFIIATYSLHHFTDEKKVLFLRFLRSLLKDGGAVLIGDVAFENRAQLDKCRKEVGGDWDNDEIYFVFDELQKEFPKMKFKKISFCAGVLILS